jgi:hypothetical protein
MKEDDNCEQILRQELQQRLKKEKMAIAIVIIFFFSHIEAFIELKREIRQKYREVKEEIQENQKSIEEFKIQASSLEGKLDILITNLTKGKCKSSDSETAS